ncbi:MAG: DUF1367 family protein, partial [Klebsiella pneumoniae]|nr:DUF1367 family protein [Klebsiella pneumoniae]
MAQTLQFEKSYQNVLIPAEPGTSEYLQLIPVGQLLCGEFRKPRNYALHKKFFKLLTLGYHYWTPSGGLIEPAERTLISGFIDFLSSDFEQRAALQNAAEMYLSSIGISRSRDMALLKHFESFREWGKRAARTVLTGMCYSVGSATRQGSSSLTRFIGQ